MLDKVKKNFYPKGRGIEDSALEDIKKLISSDIFKIILGILLVFIAYYIFGLLKNKIFKGGSLENQSGGFFKKRKN